MDTTLKSHQSALATLDEDVMRLKEKVEPPVETSPTLPSTIDDETNLRVRSNDWRAPAGKHPDEETPEWP